METVFFDLPEKDFLSPKEIAEFLNISLRTVYRLYQQGAVQGIGLNQSIRISRRSLLQYISNGIGK
jgi:excisionase family DNA binding protein